MQPFNFHQPKTLHEALAAIRGADEPKCLAGGQSLIPVLKMEMAAPSDLITLANIEELRGIVDEGSSISIGAMTTHAAVAESSEVRAAIPALAELAGNIGDPQVRNRGTLGGAVAHADPAADYPAAVLALNATVHTDRRAISADEYFTGFFETKLEEDELIVRISFPKPKRAAYAKFASPASKYALVGVMVAEQADGAVRVAVTGAAATVFRHAEMESALQANFSADAIANIRTSPDELQTDVEAGPEYRAHLISVMAKRAVLAAR